MSDGRIRVAHEDLRVVADDGVVEKGQDANGVISADRRNHALDRGVPQHVHQIRCAIETKTYRDQLSWPTFPQDNDRRGRAAAISEWRVSIAESVQQVSCSP